MKGLVYYLDGGLEIDGREILPLNPKQIEQSARDLKKNEITKVALVGVFSPLDHSGIYEERCKTLMLEVNPDLDIVCSHTISGVGLLERENATILNASILSVAKKTINSFKRAMRKLQLSCPLYLTQNDGTLTGTDEAVKLPIKTFASGPTNSMTGAAFLAGLDKSRLDTEARAQVSVVDFGGTTTDVCALLPSGFPRQAPNFV
jgi:N-methylhydantoinase A/oxoprolinase/acetone carboxylase beta subunit